MDILAFNKVNKLMKNKGAGFTETFKAVLPSKPTQIVTVEELGKEFVLVSTLTPTKEEFYDNGRFVIDGTKWGFTRWVDSAISEDYSVYIATDEVLSLAMEEEGFFLFVAYSTTATVGSITVDFPTTGIYLDKTLFDFYDSQAGFSEHEGCAWYQWETVHTIDPKFLLDSVAPKKINLEAYADDNGVDILLAIMMCPLNGDVVRSGGNIKSFWEDVTTTKKREYVVKNAVEADIHEICAVYADAEHTTPIQVCFSVFAIMGNNLSDLRAVVARDADMNSVHIFVSGSTRAIT